MWLSVPYISPIRRATTVPRTVNLDAWDII
jgi:hypothetical protein